MHSPEAQLNAGTLHTMKPAHLAFRTAFDPSIHRLNQALRLLRLSVGIISKQLLPLGLLPLRSPLACSLGLRTLGVHLLLHLLLTLLLGLGAVDLSIALVGPLQ